MTDMTSGALTPEQEEERRRNAQALQSSMGTASDAQARADTAAQNQGAASAGAPGAAYARQAGDAATMASGQASQTALAGTQAAQINNDTQSNANFGFNAQQQAARQDADTAAAAAKAYHDSIIANARGGIPDIGKLIDAGDQINKATRAQDVADINAQSANGGVERVDQQGVMPGVGGLFGMKQAQSNFTAGPVSTGALDTTASRADALAASIGARPNVQAAPAATSQAALGGAAQLQTGQSDQVRGQQQSLAQILQESAAGRGPSAAQAQLRAGIDASNANNLSLAHSGRGNSAAALHAALQQNGLQTQKAANDSAILKAQEQQAAQAQLGGVLGNTRAQDLGAATTQAGFTQQTNLANTANQQQTALANAGNQQQTSLASLQASLDQQKEKDAMQAQLLQMVQSGQMSQIQAQQQMAQFNADLQARQEAARNGQSLAAGQAGAAAIGTGIATTGSVLASALGGKK